MGKLNALKPTEEELAEAKRVIDRMTDKQRKSNNGSLNYFLRTTDDTGVANMDSRGEERTELLQRFIIYQARQKDAKRNVQSEKSNGKHQEAVNEMNHWSADKMRR